MRFRVITFAVSFLAVLTLCIRLRPAESSDPAGRNVHTLNTRESNWYSPGFLRTASRPSDDRQVVIVARPPDGRRHASPPRADQRPPRTDRRSADAHQLTRRASQRPLNDPRGQLSGTHTHRRLLTPAIGARRTIRFSNSFRKEPF
jgi:hypothetical protein